MVTWCRLPVPDVEQERVKERRIIDCLKLEIDIHRIENNVESDQSDSNPNSIGKPRKLIPKLFSWILTL